MSYTPGPWVYVPGDANRGPYVTTGYGRTICDCYAMSTAGPFGAGAKARPINFMHEMAEHNARLIAACPDMLAALHKVRMARDVHDEPGDEAWEAVIAAITKATGGTA